jgi:hypothetical protein
MTGPSWRERLKPLELVGLAAILGVFAGGIGLVGSRSLELALIFAGVAFIVGLLVLAMLALAAGDSHGTDQDGPVLDRQRPPRRPRRDRS